MSEEMTQVFEAMGNEFLRFDRVKDPPSQRPDLCAFLLLNELFPKKGNIISAAEHDEIWLDISEEDIEKLTEDQILYLVRCGVRYDNESLAMFV